MERECEDQIFLFQAGLEQILFAPVGQTQFYLGITLLEGRPWAECVQEWKEKLIPTWKVCSRPAIIIVIMDERLVHYINVQIKFIPIGKFYLVPCNIENVCWFLNFG